MRKVEEKLKQSKEKISKSIDKQIKFYSQNKENYSEYKNKILDKYNVEFEKIIDEYQSQFVNIIEEIAEAQANQKVCIANCKKLKNMQQDFLSSVEYEKYLKLKQKYKEEMDDSLTKVEFDRNLERYQNLKNPVKEYDKKIKASLEKAKSFEVVIEFGKSKLNHCMEDTITELENIVSIKTMSISVIKKNIFSLLMNKITNILIQIIHRFWIRRTFFFSLKAISSCDSYITTLNGICRQISHQIQSNFINIRRI